MRLRRLFPLAAALLAVGATPASAVTFGPDLSTATPNYPYTCGIAWAYQGCTVQDPMQNDMELVLPDPVKNGNQTGTVTAIHVKAAATAPAQFVVVEWSGKPGEGNPFPSGVMAVSERVTLKPGINDFNTNLPVDFRLASNGFESWSVVSLNILDGTSPIPAQSGGSFAETGLILDGGLPLTQTTADLTGVPHNVSIGGLPPARLLMSGEVTLANKDAGNKTCCAAPLPPAGTTTPGTDTPTITDDTRVIPASVTLPKALRFKGRAADVPVQCVGANACAGTLRIQSRRGKGVTYASHGFSLAAGAKGSVKASLSKAGRRALRRRRAVRAYANTTFADGRVTSTPITLRR